MGANKSKFVKKKGTGEDNRSTATDKSSEKSPSGVFSNESSEGPLGDLCLKEKSQDEEGDSKSLEDSLSNENRRIEEIDSDEEPEKKTIKESSMLIDVGGKPFRIELEVLEKCPLLDRLYQKPRRGVLFVDRNPKYFEFILNYLIDSQISLPLNLPELSRIKEEARVYGLVSLHKKIEQKIFETCLTELQEKEKTYLTLTLEEFYELSKINLKTTTQKAANIAKEYEVITTVHDEQPYWVCSRQIATHNSPNRCGKSCSSVFNPDRHGWLFKKVTWVIVSPIEE